MEFLTRVPEQVGDVLETLRVLQAELLPFVGDRPVLALAEEGRCGSLRGRRRGVVESRLARCRAGEPRLRRQGREALLKRLHADLARGGERSRGEPGRLVAVAGSAARTCQPGAVGEPGFARRSGFSRGKPV